MCLGPYFVFVSTLSVVRLDDPYRWWPGSRACSFFPRRRCPFCHPNNDSNRDLLGATCILDLSDTEGVIAFNESMIAEDIQADRRPNFVASCPYVLARIPSAGIRLIRHFLYAALIALTVFSVLFMALAIIRKLTSAASYPL